MGSQIDLNRKLWAIHWIIWFQMEVYGNKYQLSISPPLLTCPTWFMDGPLSILEDNTNFKFEGHVVYEWSLSWPIGFAGLIAQLFCSQNLVENWIFEGLL